MVTQREKIVAFYDKNNWIKYVPFFGKLFEDIKKFKTDPQAQKRVSDLYWKIHFYKNFHRVAPRKYVGGVLVNILGFQVARILFHTLLWKLRKRRQQHKHDAIHEAVNALDVDGVVVLTGFYTEKEVDLLIKDFETKSPQFIRHFEEFHEGLVLPTNSIKSWSHSLGSQEAKELVQENKFLNQVIEFSSGIKPKLTPEITYLKYAAKLADIGKKQVDGQDRIHCDVVYPSFKIFVYLTDTDEKNGAFKYCKGSHRLTLRRLYFEYILSIRYFLSLRKGEFKPTEITEEEKKHLDLAESSMNGKAGTVIIFNTMGFHRRGDFNDPERVVRNVILSNYRYLDSWANLVGWQA